MSYEENIKYGFVSVYRSITEWEWFTDKNTLQVFIYCLAKANYKQTKYKGTVIKRGSFVTSLDLIARECELSVMQVRTAINHLKKSESITSIFNGKGLIISIKNYDEYQDNNKQLTSKQQANNKQLTTNNKVNKVNKENNGGAHQYTADFLEFYESYKKAGFKYDCFEYWLEMEYTEEEKKHIVFAAKEYSKEMKDDVRHMVFPRTFLRDEMWKRYEYVDEDDWRKRQQEQLDYMRSMGVEK